MTQQELITANRLAISCMNNCDFAEASRYWLMILDVQPDWEHGNGNYGLAICYEELNRFDDAARCYLDSIRQEPENEIFLGGYASFLYLHGDAKVSFDIFSKLFKRARLRKQIKQENSYMIVLLDLAKRMGLSNLELQQELAGE